MWGAAGESRGANREMAARALRGARAAVYGGIRQ